MNTLLWHWYQSRPHIWFLRLRRRVPAAVLGKSWSLKQVQGWVLPGGGELVEKCFQACLKTGTWIYQVKEKYGALRFYIGSAPQWVNNLIHWAQVDSQKTCEICGQTCGRLTSGGRSSFSAASTRRTSAAPISIWRSSRNAI